MANDKIASAELKKKLDAQVESRKSSLAPEGLVPLLDKQEISDQSWYEDPSMVSRMIIDGATFGFSDELAGAIGAGISTVFGGESGKTYSQSYSEIVDKLESQRTAYEANNRGAAIGLNIVGGILTAPVSITGSIARGVGVAARGASSLLPSLGRTASSAVLFPSAARSAVSAVSPAIGKVVDAGTKIAASPSAVGAARFGAEAAATGALAGAGFAERGEDVSDAALEGALLGLTTGAAMKLVGKGVKSAVSRRVAQDLGTGDDFIPLNIADQEGTLGKLYKNVVGKVPIAGTMLKQQTERWAKPLRKDIENINAKIAARETSSVSKFLDSEANSLKSLYAKSKERMLNGISEKEEEALTLANQKRQANLTARMQRLEKIYSDAEADFRIKTTKSSIPSSARKKEVSEILNPKNNMQQATEKLSKYWTERGFEVVRGRSFRISPESISEKIQSGAGEELKDIAELYGVSKAKIPDIINEFLTSNVVSGRITGQKLTNLRNTVSRSAYSLSQTGGEGAVRGFAMTKVLSELDDAISTQLKGSDLEKFNRDKIAYKTFVNLKDSVFKASKQLGRKGSFTPDQWVSSLSTNSRKSFINGTGVFQKEADEFSALRSRIDKNLETAKDITKNNLALSSQNKRAALTLEEKKLSIREAFDQRKNIVRETESLAELKNNLAKSKSNLQKIEETLVENNNASTLLTAAFGVTLANGVFDLGTTAAFATLAGRQGVQRALAGQTGTQKAASDMLKSLTPATEALRKGVQTGVVAQEKSETSINEQLNIARTGSREEKASMFRKLFSEGKLSSLRSIDSSAFESLRSAYQSAR